jgi:pyruvate formate lyase activating enzyme
MVIGGLQKFSLIDYPGRISAIIFTQGCNFRCPFCYNPMLVLTQKVGKIENKLHAKEQKRDQPLIKEDDLFYFLKSRVGKLDAVVVTGGEPTLHKDLPEFIKRIKDFGFLVKLDTNGTNPEIIHELLNKKLIDYIAMDLKASEKKYEKVSGMQYDFKKITKSVKIIMNSKLPYEFRTTITPGLLDKNDISKMGEIIKGADNWYLQKFNPASDLIDSNLKQTLPFTDNDMFEMVEIGKNYVKNCQFR